jgi:hypothetical protein
MKKNPYSPGSEFYYKNKKCKIIRDAGHIYFTIIQYEDGGIDSVLKADLREKPSVPFKIQIIHFTEVILHYITLGDYTPHFYR